MITVKNEKTTIKELIAARVEAEVKVSYYKLPEYFKAVICPFDIEKTLNGFELKDLKKEIDIGKQILDAFQKNSTILYKKFSKTGSKFKTSKRNA